MSTTKWKPTTLLIVLVVTMNQTGGLFMFKLRFFVHCNSWECGGYENVQYFTTAEAAEDWLKRDSYCQKLSLEKVSVEEFAEDYIGEL